MISVSEAYQIVLDTARSYGKEEVQIEEAIGRVLASDIMADRPFPPYDRVTMDGIAINYESYNEGNTEYHIEQIAPAGAPQVSLSDKIKCIEVMTGAVLPHGTDTVIRYEDLEITNNLCKINAQVKYEQNVHKIGSDHNDKDILLKAGQVIKAIDINVLATVGASSIEVNKIPSVAIISSGDELVAVDSSPLAHQIRMSNVHMVGARLTELNIQSSHFHINDDEYEMKSTLSNLIRKYDVILLSGGVSKGKYDFIPKVLSELKVKCLFHKVAQRPGKPFWFGNNDETTVFAFPGNPVSTLSCLHKYFLPWLSKCIGNHHHTPSVILKSDISFIPNLTLFAQATISFENGKIVANISKGNGSGDMVHPTKMHGFVELPSGKDIYRAGEIYPFIPFYSILK